MGNIDRLGFIMMAGFWVLLLMALNSCSKEDIIEAEQSLDYCNHPLITGYFNADGTVTKYDFRKCK